MASRSAYWHALWHVDTFIGTLLVEMKSFYALGTLWARWRVDRVGTQVRMTRDLANSEIKSCYIAFIFALVFFDSDWAHQIHI